MSEHIVQDTEGTIDNRDLQGEKSLEKLPEFVFIFHIGRTVQWVSSNFYSWKRK